MTSAKLRRRSGLPKNDAADQIWDDHLGANVFTRHRDQCETCSGVYRTRVEPPAWCPNGEHLGAEAIVQHHEQCAVCQEAYRAWLPKHQPVWCPEGERLFGQMLDEVCEQMDEAIENQN